MKTPTPRPNGLAMGFCLASFTAVTLIAACGGGAGDLQIGTPATKTPTPTNTLTPTATNSPTPTNTLTPTATNSPTPTNTLTPTATNSPTPTNTLTPTATNSPTPTNTLTPTATNSPTPTPTDTPSPTATNTPTPSNTSTPTPIPLTVLHSFTGGAGDGEYPEAGLVGDGTGNFYGTTLRGGASGQGMVYKITNTGVFTPLFTFTGGAGDGGYPYGSLVSDGAGNFYGTASVGGSGNQGTVYKISSTGAFTLLHSFTGNLADGSGPIAGLLGDGAGNFYGTTVNGGTNDAGSVYKINSMGIVTLLHSFSGSVGNANSPRAGLIGDNAGNFYGTTYQGGTNNRGAVYKISSTGAFSLLYSFGGVAGDASSSQADLAGDGAGNFYGTTYQGGTNGYGTVFKISSTGIFTLLHSFGAANDGRNPEAGLVGDGAGNFYGTTVGGGTNSFGTLYKISNTGAYTLLHSFAGGASDGASSKTDLMTDGSGSLYGTTYSGGTIGHGVVFRMPIP